MFSLYVLYFFLNKKIIGEIFVFFSYDFFIAAKAELAERQSSS